VVPAPAPAVATVSPAGSTTAIAPTAGGGDKGDDGEQTLQTTRYLRVTNGTTEKLTVYVRVMTENDSHAWVWYPSAPGSDKVLSYVLDAGQALTLTDGDWQVNGSRVRLWAQSASAEYAAYRDKDLWLVPEVAEDGDHGYFSPEVQTFEAAIR
jgi:hypothetical protein